jgi:hypothetical protein
MKFLQKALPTLLLISGIMIHANGQAIILISEFVPCANGGAGEIVEGELTADIISAPGRNSNSLPILRVSGILNGFETGTEYQADYVYTDGNFRWARSAESNGAVPKTTVEKLRFVGGETVFIMSVISHLIIREDDILIVEIEHNMEKCLTKRFRN